MKIIDALWSDVKAFATARAVATQWVVANNSYYVHVFDGPFGLACVIPQDGSAAADQTDFETNFKAAGNVTLTPRDADGVNLSRTKQTTLGWTFQSHSFEFNCATVGGALYSKDWTGTDFGFVTPKFYELISGVETLITGANATDQGYLTANCCRSTFLWEPGYDYDIMSGELRFYDAITTDVRLWITAVPDVPAYLGGSKQLDTGGRNLRYTPAGVPIVLDGRVVKHLAYNATYHTNKFAFTLRHPAGFATPMQVTCQFYKL